MAGTAAAPHVLHIRHDGQITPSAFPKTGQPLAVKIFRFSEHATHAISASPRAPGGRIAIANGSLGAGCDGRRPAAVIFTGRNARQADGKAVWSRRRDRGVYPPLLAGDGNGGKKTPFTGESAV